MTVGCDGPKEAKSLTCWKSKLKDNVDKGFFPMAMANKQVKLLRDQYIPKGNKKEKSPKVRYRSCDKNRQKAILTGLPIFLGERVAAHTQATTAWHSISCESFKNIYSFEHYTLLEDFRNKKNEYHF